MQHVQEFDFIFCKCILAEISQGKARIKCVQCEFNLLPNLLSGSIPSKSLTWNALMIMRMCFFYVGKIPSKLCCCNMNIQVLDKRCGMRARWANVPVKRKKKKSSSTRFFTITHLRYCIVTSATAQTYADFCVQNCIDRTTTMNSYKHYEFIQALCCIVGASVSTSSARSVKKNQSKPTAYGAASQ